MGSLADNSRVVIVGGGKMGEAILSGWLGSESGASGGLGAESFVVVNPGVERCAYLAERYGVACVGSVADVDRADLVVLAVKPQVMMGVLQKISALDAFSGGCEGPLFVSIAAGLTTSRLEGGLPASARLVRVMPNMPLMIGAGATSVTSGAFALEGDVPLVRDLFSDLGAAVVVDEEDMDATCAVSGSGPAYVAAMIEALAHAGVSQGLDEDVAEDLALQTVFGTALLIKETGRDVAEVRQSICSPGGTTIAALEAMGKAGFNEVFEAGVAAAVNRSKELASC